MKWMWNTQMKFKYLLLKETRNPSKMWPLDFDFLADFMKYWKEWEVIFFKFNIFRKLRIRVISFSRWNVLVVSIF